MVTPQPLDAPPRLLACATPLARPPMADRKSFLLRMDPALFTEIERLAQADLRSVNAQMEFLLRDALASYAVTAIRVVLANVAELRKVRAASYPLMIGMPISWKMKSGGAALAKTHPAF